MYIDPAGTLWAVASTDEGDNGPFRSVIYRVGQVTTGVTPPVNLAPSLVPDWIVDGLKVEALAAPAAAVPASVLSVGTDDENYGGVWRPLFRPVGGP